MLRDSSEASDEPESFIAFVSVYLTVRARFFQVARFAYIMRNTFGRMFERRGDSDKEKMTPFQATSTSLAGTVGMGNMAGVATALSIGGPGAIFWMWVPGILRHDHQSSGSHHCRALSRRG